MAGDRGGRRTSEKVRRLRANIARALAGSAKLSDLQSMLRSATSRTALRGQLKAMLSSPSALASCRPRRTRFDFGRKLRVYYDARFSVKGTEGHQARPIAVTWRPHQLAEGCHPSEALAGMQTEALRRGLATPFGQLTAEVPEWGLHIQVSPLDAQFPQLVRLSDPNYVRDLLAGTAHEVAGQDSPRGYTVTSLRYLPGNCHVLRYDPLGTSDGTSVFAKLYSGDEGARVFRLATRMTQWLTHHAPGLFLVSPLAYLEKDGAVLYSCATGAPLSDYLWHRRRGGVRCLERAGAALQVLQHFPLEVADSLQLRDFAGEVNKIARASAHISPLLPSAGAAIEALLDVGRELYERLPHEPPTFTFGESKAEHVWITPEALTLIDYDSCCLADPAADIGKLLADLRFWYAAYDQRGMQQAQEQFLRGYAPGVPRERLVRARLYEAIELIKMTARRVHLFELDWKSRTERLVTQAWTLMNNLQLEVGVSAAHSLRGECHHQLAMRANQA